VSRSTGFVVSVIPHRVRHGQPLEEFTDLIVRAGSNHEVPCDRVEQGTAKTTLVGTFSGVAAEQFPSPPKDLHIYAQLTSFVGNVRVKLVCLRVSDDEADEVYSTEHVVRSHGKLTVEQTSA